MNAWTTQHAIEHIVAPAESHRLALVERRHVTLRRAIEIYMDDMKVTGTKGIRQALTYVVPQLNDTVSVAGYSPSQWLLGKVPRLPGGLMQEELAPAHLGDHDQFEQLLQQRAAAKRALISADLDAKLRRALLRQYQGTDLPLQIGQKCFFWRDQRQDRLVKIRWHGPARVVMVEYSKDEKPELYWLAYKTQLIRCSPHHVRADFTAADTQLADAQEARREVASLRSRGVTRFLDLNKINRRRRLEDFNEDDIASGSEAGDDDADDLQPPTTRQRTSYDTTAQRPELSLDEAIRELGLEDEDELSMARPHQLTHLLSILSFLDKHNLLFFQHQLSQLYHLQIKFHKATMLCRSTSMKMSQAKNLLRFQHYLQHLMMHLRLHLTLLD